MLYNGIKRPRERYKRKQGFTLEEGMSYARYKRKCEKMGYDPNNIISLEVLSRSSLVKDFAKMYHNRKKKQKKKAIKKVINKRKLRGE